jgi:squalene synthase HpnC
MSAAEAVGWCRRCAVEHAENFPVLSALLPTDLRGDFAAVYAFCRWADDLGDESGTPERASELLAWWRRELEACVAGAPPTHPVFLALQGTMRRHDLPAKPFHDLISAFEQDQRQSGYERWEELLDYCRLSADPVGRLVLMLLGEPRDERLFDLSDRICTALQLTNHWQDIRRDWAERGRLYVPRELNPIQEFERRLDATIRQGFGCDHRFLEESRRVVRSLVERTWPLFDEGREIQALLSARSRPVVELFIEGGEHILTAIGRWNWETVLHRPRLSKPVKLWLVGRAWSRTLWRRGRGATAPPRSKEASHAPVAASAAAPTAQPTPDPGGGSLRGGTEGSSR